MKYGCEQLIEKSRENMDVANVLAGNRQFDAAANRLYYSLFQVVKAYAVNKGKMTIDEKDGVHQKANNIVVALVKDEGRFDDVFEDALVMRKKADYTPNTVTASEIDTNFRTRASDLRNHLEQIAESA